MRLAEEFRFRSAMKRRLDEGWHSGHPMKRRLAICRATSASRSTGRSQLKYPARHSPSVASFHGAEASG
jgi:hypothetical protein